MKVILPISWIVILEVRISAVVDLIYLIITALSTQLCAVFQDIKFSMD